jgi:hypothetical protein
MLKVLRSRLGYANVMATVALFVALGGSAYALGAVPDAAGVFHGCVNEKSGDLRVVISASSCRAVKKRHGRVVFSGEFAIAWSAQGAPGAQGVPGAAGQQGKAGIQGSTGPTGVTNVVVRAASNTCSTLHCLASARIDCNTGEQAISGGAQGEDGDGIAQSVPAPYTAGVTPVGWSGSSYDSDSDASASVDVFVVCASP